MALVLGVVKSFQKNRTTLGWVATIGLFVALVGYAGWFVNDRTSVS